MMSSRERNDAIDHFRGLAILGMVLVNYLAEASPVVVFVEVIVLVGILHAVAWALYRRGKLVVL